MMQSNNADLGKAFPGGMEDMVPGKASFFEFAWPGRMLVLRCTVARAVAVGSNLFR